MTKILLNGKEFFLNDMETAMKNIPTDMIEKIKTYEKKSDLARITVLLCLFSTQSRQWLFYASKTYQQLQQENTKLWHLGAIGLYELYSEA